MKPNRTGDTTVRALLQAAYRFGYLPFQVIGGPSWLDSDRFDVEGRAGGSPSPADVDAMVRSMLVSRFKVAYAKETRDMPVYHLIARADGRAGAPMRPASKPCDRTSVSVNTPPDPNALPRCGARFARGPLGQRIAGIGATLDELAQRLAAPSQRIVVNRTRLDGAFDFEIDYTPDNNRAGANAAADTGVVLSTALQEQLGLRWSRQAGQWTSS